MSRYDEDVAALKKWETVRLVGAIATTFLFVVDRFFRQPWLGWVEAFGAAVTGVALFLEGRAASRLGRSPTTQYVAGAVMLLAAYLIAP
jgi:hypothetical protein